MPDAGLPLERGRLGDCPPSAWRYVLRFRPEGSLRPGRRWSRKATGRRAALEFSFQVLCLNGKESLHDRSRLFPASGFRLQLLAAPSCEGVKARPATILGGPPFGLYGTFLHQFK